MKLQKLSELDQRNKELLMLIAQAQQVEDTSVYAFKKELYENKIKMIEIITFESKRAGITARELQRLVLLKPKAIRYETGIEALDSNLLGGIEVGTFIQLAGESGVGKTHLLLELLLNIANYSKSVFFNFEMGDTRVVKKLQKLIKNNQQWDNLIIDNDSRDLDVLCNEITLYAQEGIKFFTIDSKMKIEVNTKQEEHIKFSSISKRLSALSQKYDIIIFLINQMSEQDIKNKRLAFKGSGDQQYDSDISLFYVKDEKNKRKLICNKNRQDEREFSIDLFLDHNGRTCSNYPNSQQVFNSSPVVTEYIPLNNDSIRMEKI